jgi:CubicO group peptidase (beta-lactamase class C family)
MNFLLNSRHIALTFVGSMCLLGQGVWASNGLAPEVTDLNAKDVSYALEQKLPDLKEPFIDPSPADKQDGLPVGELGKDGGDRAKVMAFVDSIIKDSGSPKIGQTDSFLVTHKGKLIFESYYRRGRLNYPHYQMSITKSYAALAIGRAIQLGYLSMEDLHKPVVSFLKELDLSKLAEGADTITLHQAMHMNSGIRLDQKAINSAKGMSLVGQGQIQAYLQNSAAIGAYPRLFKYQGADPCLTMQVLQAVVPMGAEAFIRDELLKPLGISQYYWQNDTSGYPKSAAGCSFRSRDMMKFGLLVQAKGKWKGVGFIPEAFIDVAVNPVVKAYGKSHYGYFWWVEDIDHDGKSYRVRQGRGAGGQFIYMVNDLDLIVVVTAHNKGMGDMLHRLAEKVLPAFVK